MDRCNYAEALDELKSLGQRASYIVPVAITANSSVMEHEADAVKPLLKRMAALIKVLSEEDGYGGYVTAGPK